MVRLRRGLLLSGVFVSECLFAVVTFHHSSFRKADKSYWLTREDRVLKHICYPVLWLLICAAIPRTSDKSNRVEIRRRKIELRNAFITRCGVTFPCLVQLLITDWPRLFKLSTTTGWSPRTMMDHGSHSPGCPALTHHHTHYLTCPGVISSLSPTRFSVSNYILFAFLSNRLFG